MAKPSGPCCRCRSRTKAERGYAMWESDYGWWLGQKKRNIADYSELLSIEIGVTILIVYCPWCGKRLPRRCA